MERQSPKRYTDEDNRRKEPHQIRGQFEPGLFGSLNDAIARSVPDHGAECTVAACEEICRRKERFTQTF